MAFSTHRDLLVAAKLENIIKAANASLQNQNLQAMLEKTAEILNSIKNTSKITGSDTSKLDDLLHKWISNTKRYEELQEDESEEEDNEKEEGKTTIDGEQHSNGEDKEKQNEGSEKTQNQNNGRKKEEKEQREREAKKQREEKERREIEQKERLKREKERREIEEKERHKREKEEQILMELKKRKEQEEREREIKEENERLIREEKERKEMEEMQKKRSNPIFWEPFIYNMLDDNIIDEHNGGICCVAYAIPNSIIKDDLCCFCSEHSEHDNIIECIHDDEQIASLITNIESTNCEEIALERPLRVYVPHQFVSAQNRSIAVKVSVDDGEWKRVDELKPYYLEGKENLHFVGFEINNFTCLKILAVTRIKPEKFKVPQEGILYQCLNDKDVSVMFPESVFKEPTEVSLTANSIPKTDTTAARINHATLFDVYESSSVISIDCCATTEKQFQLTIKGLKLIGKYDKFNAIYKEKDGKWKLADYKITDNKTVITIPEDVSYIRLIGLTLPRHTPIEQVFEAASEMEKHSNEIKVQVVCKQKCSHLNDTHIACISSERKQQYIDGLMLEGYSEGPATSKEFCISEGKKIHFYFSGNVDIDSENEKPSLVFLKNFLNCLTCHIHVVNEHIQKKEEMFRGYLKFTLQKQCINTNQQLDQLPLFLEKQNRKRKAVSYKSKFVMKTTVTALVKYISWKLNVNDSKEAWNLFVSCLESKPFVRRLENKSKKYAQNESQRRKCEEFFKMWIKDKPKSIDKVDLIMKALEASGFRDLKNSAQRFIEFFKVNGVLSDNSLIKMSEKIGMEWEMLGISLGLTTAEIEHIKMDFASARLRIYHMLDHWRMSDHAIEQDQDIISELVDAMSISNCNNELIEFLIFEDRIM